MLPIVVALTAEGARLRTETDVMIGLEAEGIPVDIVQYPYAPLRSPQPGPAGFPVASPLDLGVMKLSAISKRGLRRDFWDLFVIIHEAPVSLKDLLAAYRARYRRGASDEYHLLRSLTYFVDAERDDPRVVGLTAKKWALIREFFIRETTALVKADRR